MERTLTGPAPALRLPPGATDTQMHCYLPGFPGAPGALPVPEGDASPDAYRQGMGWLGIERVVVVQGNAHAADNSNILAALADFGDIARGVGVIGPDTPAAELARLHRGGIRGARLMNLPGGAVGLEALGPVDAMACDMGWSVNVQFDGGEILDRLPALKGIRARWILDHHGKFFAGATPGDARIAAVKRLIDRGNCWFKMAGGYESSRSGAPDFADIGAVAREIIAHAPERVIWGTNWPHNLVKRAEDYPSDADLLDTVLGWAPDEATRRLILVDNPAALYGFGAD